MEEGMIVVRHSQFVAVLQGFYAAAGAQDDAALIAAKALAERLTVCPITRAQLDEIHFRQFTGNVKAADPQMGGRSWAQFLAEQAELQRDIERARAYSNNPPIGARIEGGEDWAYPAPEKPPAGETFRQAYERHLATLRARGEIQASIGGDDDEAAIRAIHDHATEEPAKTEPEPPRHSADDYGAIARRLSEIGVKKWADDPEG